MSTMRRTRRLAAAAFVLGATLGLALALPATADASIRAKATTTTTHVKPTIVLVHGAWADTSSWAPVTAALQAAGYTVLVAPVSLRTLDGDASALTSFIAQRTSGPVVLVGHSYGGAVITDSGLNDPNVKALVYVDAFMPAEGQSLGDIIAGSTSALNVDSTSVFDISTFPEAPANDFELYLKPSTFAQSFAQDVPAPIRNVLEAGQMPVTTFALGEPSTAPAWASIPSWDVVGTQDKVLPEATQLSMARRAGSKVVEVNAGHLSMISKPLQVTSVIIQAAISVH